MVRFVALAVLLAIGAGVYAFIQVSNVTAIQMQLNATTAELEKWKTSTSQYQAASKEATANLDTCTAKVMQLTLPWPRNGPLPRDKPPIKSSLRL